MVLDLIVVVIVVDLSALGYLILDKWLVLAAIGALDALRPDEGRL